MTYAFLRGLGLLDFFVNRHLFKDGVVLLHFQTIGRILLVLRRDVTGSAGLTAGLVLGALEDDLNAIAFLCHFLKY